MEFDACTNCLTTIEEGVSSPFRGVYCRIRFFGSVLPRDDLDAMEGLPRGHIEGVTDFGLAGFERVQPGRAGGAETACLGAGEEGEKCTDVAACGALVGSGEGGVKFGEGYPSG